MVRPWFTIISLALVVATIAPTITLAEYSETLELHPADQRTSISEYECGAQIDMAKNFPEVRNQKGLGLCWSFATAALIEEHLCLNDPSSCGKVLSELYISLAEWDLGTDKVGAHTYDALKAVFSSMGVCEAQYAPYPDLKTLGCALNGQDPASCMVNKLKDLYTANHSISTSQPEAIKWRPIQKILGENYDQEELIQGLRANDEGRDFLKAALIPKQCQENLTPAAELPPANIKSIDTLEWINDAKSSKNQLYKAKETFAWEIKYNLIANVMNKGRSVGISFCSGLMLSQKKHLEKNLSNYNNAGCGPHAVVLIGKRWNAKQKRCEFNLRNSWGNDQTLSGWMSADKILSSSYRLTWLEDL